MRSRLVLHAFSFIVLSVIIFSSILTGTLSAAQGTQAGRVRPEAADLKIGVPAIDPNFLPNWAAEQAGFFKEEGFADVKILSFQGDAPTLQALAGGTVDLCVASLTGLVNAITSGQRFKAVWAGYNMAHFEWYALPNIDRWPKQRVAVME